MELRAELGGACQSSLDEDRELVTADARQLVLGVGKPAQRVRQVAELLVSGRVSVRVVQQLQVVHVSEHEKKRRFCVTAPRKHFVEDTVVQKAGQKVAVC